MTDTQSKKPKPGARPIPAADKLVAAAKVTQGGVKKVATAQQLKVIEELAAQGKREKGIFLILNLCIHTWMRWKHEDPRVVAALERGNERFHDALLDDVKRMGKANNIVAPLFLLKSRFGYREGDAPQEMRPQIVINLPGPAASAEDYRKLIDVTPARPAIPAELTTTSVPATGLPIAEVATASPEQEVEQGDDRG